MFETVFINIVEPTVCVVDQDDLLGAQAPLGENQGTDDIISDNASCITDDVRIAMGKTKHLKDVHTTVHTGHDGEMSFGG